MLEISNVIIQTDLTGIYKTFQSTQKNIPFPQKRMELFPKLTTYLESLNRCKKAETIPYVLSDHRRLKLDTNNIRNNRKLVSAWRQRNSVNEKWLKTN